jgi:hypothetical protein
MTSFSSIINTSLSLSTNSCNLALKISGKGSLDINNPNNTDGIAIQLLSNVSSNQEFAFIDTSNSSKLKIGLTSNFN